jgi:Xaa-Pro aminopeptidase
MFHTNNRKRLFAKAKGELIILTAYDSMQQSGDMAAPFLQESSFWWVTGINQPGWKVVLDTARGEATLVRPQRSEVDVIFNGESDDNQIRATSGIQHIIPQREFEAYLRQLHRHHTIAYTLTQKEDHEFMLNPAKSTLVSMLKRIFQSVQYCDALFAELKAIKQPEELARMRAAMKLTCDTFALVQSRLADFKTEAEIEAEFIYAFHKAGADHAYEPIVASGNHACTLHYVNNSGKLRAREMVLIDIGARVDGYSADVTRTYCRNPTKRQVAVHAAVVEAEQAIIELITPGLPIVDYLKQVDEIMKRALLKLGLLTDMNDTDMYRKYFPHAVSHGLGVDTHDSLGRPRYLEVGMVLTVEPGIYIPEESIGVRIEDDILVTKNGNENMTGHLSTALTI